ncbi:MAG TPA: TPM domain-containing protein [Aestuariivirgaceae bacterium]|nr:TPM domain-containing protein [Aestuariivirgaceae bacterium]
MRRISTSISLFAVLLLGAIAWAWPHFAGADPQLVEDDAGLLSSEQRDTIALHHAYLLSDFDIDYRVITAANAGDLVGFGAERYAALEVGSLSEASRGLLLVIDPGQDRVRLEVGHALEGVYTDGFVAYIEQRQMVPFFQAERIADGVLATTELIVQEAQEAVARSGFDVAPGVAGSGGAGATAKARIGEAAPVPEAGPEVAAGRSPAETLQAYFDAMGNRDGRSDLDIYTGATQAMLKSWVMTPAQMDNVVRSYRGCTAEPAKLGPDGQHAVIRYGTAERQCSPWFFAREAGTWKLDFTVMQEAIRFGRDNSWRFANGVPGRYDFAFADWTFDGNGFPVAR